MTEGLLALIRACGNRIEGRLRVQKAAYLLKLLGAAEFRRTPYRYHHYGPYSRELSGSLHQAVAAGRVTETAEEMSDELTRYRYELTPAGQQWLGGFQSDIETRFSEKIPPLGDADLKTLELAATIAFLEREEGLPSKDAIQRARQLKPECVASEDKALRLLGDLGIAPLSS